MKELKNNGFHIGGSNTNVEKTQYLSFFIKSLFCYKQNPLSAYAYTPLKVMFACSCRFFRALGLKTPLA